MNQRFLHKALRFLALPAIGGIPSLGAQGNIVDAAATQAAFNYIGLYGGVQANFSAVTNASTTALALTPANCAQGIVNAVVVASGGSANTNTTDTATAIINNYWQTGVVGSRALLLYVNNNSGTNTLAGGTNVTLTGTATIPTLALAYYGLTLTNLANPAAVGAVSTNSTTTTAAVAVNSTQASPTSVIPVAASTGISTVAGASWLKVINTDGSTSNYQVSSVSSLNITVMGAITKAIASGAAVTVFNNQITMLRLFSTVTATTAA